ncbi:LysR family transcriptional regulator [Actinosynnema mirum]|uniref:Transcriptional regulator, LysR family n=1 Tax=Actinosynnema mirum (strain ATCC 29888 / DSM 43827 / JCM 3225 / NBRC 14064 / NCIMB 13271 / NRRL B-12336 / IMRU 3971 / 101) TaxID=446462 RepID=C6WBU7_ACTMD|nr:LysR family transcriptional regulator [Actinosynnema mirum]ACU37514.1 transcriptional regulator, LysR family [Actinosynnema mirum DSM 43827]
MDVENVRAFVAAAESGRLGDAAVELGISQQAVSKRVGALERAVGVALFARTPRGVRLTLDGAVFLPHARAVLRAVERAARSVRPENRVLRVDVPNLRTAPSTALRAFHAAHPEVALEVVTLPENHLGGALEAVRAGAVDASFRAVPLARADLPDGVRTARAVDSGLELLVGPRHPLADRAELAPVKLAGHRVWVPGIRPGTEWARFYRDFAGAFGAAVDGAGPHFGDEALLEVLAGSAEHATIVGSGDHYLWPAVYDLRRIPLRDPTPVYPHRLLWSTVNDHPGLADLRAFLTAGRARAPEPVWEPSWA